MAYQRITGTNDVYDTSSGTPQYVSYDQAVKNNLFAPGKIQDVASITGLTDPKASNPSVITPESLQNTDQFPLVQPQNTTPFDVQGLDSTNPTTALTSQETKIQKGQTDIAALNTQLLGKSAYQKQQEANFGVDVATSNINDLGARLTSLKNDALAIPVNAQSRAAQGTVLTGGLQADVNQQLRDNAVAALGVSSLLAASQGQLATAQSLADRAVSQKYDPILEQIDVMKQNLQLIIDDPLTSLQDKNRAIKQQELQAEKAQKAQDARDTAKQVSDLSLLALKYGADPATAQKMQSATSLNDAIAIGGKFLRDPQAQYEVESARLDTILKRTQIAESSARTAQTRAETAQIGQPTKAELAQQQKDAEAAKNTIPILDDKLNLINSLTTSGGLSGVVGPNRFARLNPIAGITGSSSNFIAGVEQLTNRETLDQLLNLKAQGGTLGALSDQEGKLLASAASKIGTWRIKDKNGTVTGYNASEKDFKAELDKIKQVTQRAIDRSTGKIISSDEQSALTEFYSADNSAFLSPANYFK